MTNLTSKTLSIHGEVYLINRFEVWFQTPFGLISNHEEALQFCKKNDLDPDLSLLPVPVAIAENNFYEIIQRH